MKHTVREVTITIDPEEDHPAGAVLVFYMHGGVFYPSVNGDERPTFPAGEIAARVARELEALTGPPRAVGDEIPMIVVSGTELDRLRAIEAAARAYVDTPGGALEEYEALRKALARP